MTRVNQQLVNDILEQVQLQVGATSFNVWFKDATHIDVEDGQLTVGVPNLFVCDYMESRFAGILTGIAREKLGSDVAVRFQIDARLFQQRRRAELGQSEEFLEAEAGPVAPKPRPEQPNVATAAAADSPNEAPELTLDRFVVGDCNRMAYAAALEVAGRPGKAFNPLFIHGACGLGKTHLLQGIAHAVRRQHRGARVLYVTAEQFTNRYIMAVKTRSLDAFRHRFRNLDLLVIDDIHFLANKEATQEEFLHTFNTFDLGKRQVVMASDCHPKMLSCIQETLISRFVAGMVAEMSRPDRRTRVEILRRKAQRMGAAIADDVLTFVAMHVAGSVRELEGSLIRVIAYASLDKQPVTLSLAQEALAESISAGQKRISLTAILDVVCQFFGAAKADVLGRRRTRTVTLPRQLAMYVARRLVHLSFPEIGRLMGDKNHSTVIAACKRVDKMVGANELVTWHDGSVTRQMRTPELIQALEDRLRS